MLELLSQPDTWVSLLTLSILEIVLGIDNIVFISILAGKLPEAEREKARKLGLSLAMITRILFLLGIGMIMKLTEPVIKIAQVHNGGLSVKDLILVIGGLFLIYKSVKEIHGKLEGEEHASSSGKSKATITSVVAQILVIDIVFSIDSVITAVGMAKHVEVMIAAVVISVLIMLAYSGPVAKFVDKHPTVKMLALSFLLLIGVNLVAEGLGQHIEKGYTYFAMAFAVGVEVLNLRLRSKSDPVKLRSQIPGE
jgi:predicted tellurium resistance membrane protein TerC